MSQFLSFGLTCSKQLVLSVLIAVFAVSPVGMQGIAIALAEAGEVNEVVAEVATQEITQEEQANQAIEEPVAETTSEAGPTEGLVEELDPETLPTGQSAEAVDDPKEEPASEEVEPVMTAEAPVDALVAEEESVTEDQIAEDTESEVTVEQDQVHAQAEETQNTETTAPVTEDAVVPTNNEEQVLDDATTTTLIETPQEASTSPTTIETTATITQDSAVISVEESAEETEEYEEGGIIEEVTEFFTGIERVQSALELAAFAQSGDIVPTFDVSGQAVRATFARDFIFEESATGLEAKLESGLVVETADGAPFDVSALGIEITDAGNAIAGDRVHLEFGIPGQHLVFSQPVQITVPVDLADGTDITLSVRHAGEDFFGATGLAVNADAVCSAGVSTDESNVTTVANGQVVFYTCGASEFILDPNENNQQDAVLWLSTDNEVFERDVSTENNEAENNDEIYRWGNRAANSNDAFCPVGRQAFVSGGTGITNPVFCQIATPVTGGTNSTEQYDDLGYEFHAAASELVNFHPVLRAQGRDSALQGELNSGVVGDNDDSQAFFMVSKTRDTNVNVDNANVFHFTRFDGEFGIDYDKDNDRYNIGDGPGFVSTPDGSALEWTVLSGVTDGTNYAIYSNGTLVGNIPLSGATPEVANGYYVIGDIGAETATFQFGSDYTYSVQSEGVINEITEIIIYNREVEAERENIESYLAFKYGIGLDQTAPRDYIDSDGNIFWDASVNTTYNNHILGIGKDDGYGLDQRAGTSITDEAVLNIALQNNFTDQQNDGDRNVAHVNDQQFTVLGTNAAGLVATSTEVDSAGAFDQRIEREWFVQQTANFAQDVYLEFDGFNSAWTVFVDSDGDFTTGATALGQLDNNGALGPVSLADGTYLTLGRSDIAPGGVTTGLEAWFDASENVDITSSTDVEWTDRSAAGLVLDSQSGETGDPKGPTLTNDALNFSPALTFDSGDDGLFTGTNSADWDFSEFSVYSVQKNDQITGTTNDDAQTVWHYGDSGDNDLALFLQDDTDKGYSISNSTATNPVSNTELDDGVIHVTNYVADSSSDIVYIDGATDYTGTGLTGSLPGDGCFTIGVDQDGSADCEDGDNHFGGDIGEVAVYSQALSGIDKQRVDSYFAFKYGVSLGQTAPVDYLAADAVTEMWDKDATDASIYNNNIIGLGRDDAADLHVRVTTVAAEDGAGLHIATDNDFTSANDDVVRTDVVDNTTFITIADNGADVASTTVSDLATGFTIRMEKEWLVQNNGFDEPVTLKFPMIEGENNWKLLVDDDGDFTNGGDSVLFTFANGTDGVVPNVTLNGGEYLSLQRLQVAPGGIATDLNMWYNADNYDYVSATDATLTNLVGIADTNMTQSGVEVGNASAIQAPTLAANSLNFNPALDFTSTGGEAVTGQALAVDLSTAASFPTGNISIFTVQQAEVNPRVNSSDFAYTYWHYDQSGNNQLAFFSPGSTSETQFWINNSNSTTTTDIDTGEPTLVSFVGNNSTARATISGVEIYNQSLVVSSNNNGCFGLGYDKGGSTACSADGDFLDGQIGEVIVYDTALTGTDLQAVESYMAFKYGFTLDQTVATNYLSSSSTVPVWTNDSDGYQTNVFGIGRDDVQGLDQRVSKSQDDGALLTVALDADFTSANKDVGRTTQHENEIQFLTFANDNASTTATSTNTNETFNERIERTWKVDANNFTQAVNLKFDGFDDMYALVIDDDGDFSAGATTTGMLDGSGEITNVTLSDGDYLTLMRIAEAPGGVTPNLQLWLKADAGVTDVTGQVSNWLDQSVNGYDIAQDTSVDQPELLVAQQSTNFNPTIGFDASNSEYFDNFLTFDGSGFVNGHSIYLVGYGTATSDDFFNITNGTNSTAVALETNGPGALRYIHRAPPSGTGGDSLIGGTISTTGNNLISLYHEKSTEKHKFLVNGGSANGDVDTGPVENNHGASDISSINVGRLNQSAGRYLDGEIAEFIIYTGDNEAEGKRIESYLALKYGITLDQTTDTDYFATDCTDGTCSTGTKMWTNDADGYESDIFGIGRDDIQGLDQRVSRSVAASSVVTVALDPDFTSSNASTSRVTEHDENLQFLAIAHNGTSTAMIETEVPDSFNMRTAREWKVDATDNFSQTVNVKFDGYDDNYTLLIDGDDDFSDAFLQIPLNANGEVENLLLSDGLYFTLATVTEGPGGVTDDLLIWTTPESGVHTTGNSACTDAATTTDGVDLSEGCWTSAGGSKNIDFAALDAAPTVTLENGTGDLNNFHQTVSMQNALNDAFFGDAIDTETVQDVYLVFRNSNTYGFLDGVFGNTNFQGNDGDPGLRLTSATALDNGPNSDNWAEGTASQLRINGEETATIGTDWNIITAERSSAVTDNFTLGGYYDGVGADDRPLTNGDFSEVIVYSGDKTTDDRQQVESYLALKYGITLVGSTTNTAGSSIIDLEPSAGGFVSTVVNLEDFTQSFQSTVTGDMGGVRAYLESIDSGGGTFDMHICNGNVTYTACIASPDHTTIGLSVPGGAGSQPQTDLVLSSPFGLVSGSTYTVAFEETTASGPHGFSVSMYNENSSDAYTGGTATAGFASPALDTFPDLRMEILGVGATVATAPDYIASNGTTTMWTAADNVGYDNDIFGIGRDDVGGLNQVVSRSSNDGDVLMVALEQDFISANSGDGRIIEHQSNLQFLTFANNSATTTATTTELNTSLYSTRVEREWKVDATNFEQQVFLAFEGYDDTWALISDNDGDFSDATYVGELDSNGYITYSPTDGEYLTLAQTSALCIWDGEGTGDEWSNAFNWAGDVVPAPGCNILFDNTSSDNALVDGAADVSDIGSITITSDYDGDIDFATSSPTINGDFTAAGTQSIDFGEASVTMVGDLDLSGQALYDGATSTITMATSSVVTTAASSSLYNLTVATGTVTMVGDQDFDGDITINAGATLLPGATSTIVVAGDWNNSGTFTQRSTTVVLDGSADQNVLGTTTFNNLTIEDEAARTVGFVEDVTQTVAGTLAADGSATTTISIRTVDATGTVLSDDSQHTINVTGSFGTIDYVDVRDAILQENGAVKSPALDPANSTDSGNQSGWFASSVLVEFSALVASGTEAVASSSLPTLRVAGGVLSATSSIDIAVATSSTATTTDYSFATTTVTVPAADYTATTSIDLPLSIIEDFVDETDEALIMTLVNPQGISIGDASGDSTTIATSTYTIVDNDTAGVTLSATSSTAVEGGATTTYTVVLDTVPTANVEISLSANNGEATTTPATLTFTPANATTTQTVTVTAIDDALADGNLTDTISHTASSTDTNYSGIAIDDHTAIAVDNDVPAVNISATSTSVVENLTNTSVTVVLGAQPASNVVITLSSSDTGAAIVSSPLTFSTSTYNIPQTIIITGVDDADTANESVTITIAVDDANSDNTYDPLADQAIVVIVADDDIDTDNDGIPDAVENALCAAYPILSSCPDPSPTDDEDGDGIPDVTEFTSDPPSDPTDPDDPVANGDDDTDGDGIPNGLEGLTCSLHPTLPTCAVTSSPVVEVGPNDDADGDGIPDAVEVSLGYDPTDPNDPTVNGGDDDDNDGVTNAEETLICMLYPTLASCTGVVPSTGIDLTSDGDGDGIPDVVELSLGSNPTDPNDPVAGGSGDGDGDDITNGLEALTCSLYPTLPNCAATSSPVVEVQPTDDTDGDGIPDAVEVSLGYDPTDPNDPTVNGGDDDDNDGVTNAVETAICIAYPTMGSCTGTAPSTGVGMTTDADGDGIPDVVEFANGSNPTDPNDPTVNGGDDDDNDGLANGLETAICTTYPTLSTCTGVVPSTGVDLTSDGDGDGVPDWIEFLAGTSPTDPNDPTNGATSTTDIDGDTVPDAVEDAMCVAYPTLASCADVALADGVPDVTSTTDTDNDGIPDITEFLNGSDPTSAGADSDTDGVPDAVEMAGDNPVNGVADGNDDGIPDHLQSEVAGVRVVSDISANNSLYQTVEITEGACEVIDEAEGLAESAVQSDAGLEFPLGLIDYTLECNTVGATSTVRVYYSEERTDTGSWTIKKHDGSGYSDVSGVTLGIASIGGNNRTYFEFEVEDGGALDTDGVANGIIVDPVGPSTVVTTSSGGGGGGGSSKPDIETNSVIDIKSSSATLRGELNDEDEWTVWFALSSEDTTPSCSDADLRRDVSGTYDEDDIFTLEVTGLESETEYYVRACGQYEGSSSTKSGKVKEFVTDTFTKEEVEKNRLQELINALQQKINEILGQQEEVETEVSEEELIGVRKLLGGAEPNVPAEFQGEVCTRYLKSYIFPGSDNNSQDVVKLQTYLNEVYGENLTIDGIYDADDIEAVKRYQLRYKEQVLFPWGLTTPTANVYQTTATKINLGMCGYEMNEPYFTEYLRPGDVSLEAVRVQDFLNLINAPTGGYPNNGLPLATTFTQETKQAVIDYQNRYRATVLDPWGLSQGTGWWYQTTRSSANALVGTPEPEIQLDNGKSHTAF